MKINAINSYTINSYKTQKPIKQSKISYTNKPDTVCFKSKKYITDLRQIPNITCACCGCETIQNTTIDKLLHNKIYYPADEALSILKKAGYFKRKEMSHTEQQAYNFCYTYSKLYEHEYIKDIFDKEHVKNLIKTFDKQTQNDIRKIELMTSSVYHNSKYMVEVLRPYKNIMHSAQKEVFDLLEKESKKTPEKTFTEILSSPSIRKNNLYKLEKKQELVFAEVEKIASKMDPKSYKIVLRRIRKAKIIFDKPNSEIQNKRTYVIDMFKKLEEQLPDNPLMLQILSKIYELPSSKNDANSFIIKYGTNNPNVIAERLLRDSAATIEHVKPKNRKNDNGENKISNYVVFCNSCNSERSQMPYSEFIKFHPDMPENSQKYLDIVIENINNGTLEGYDKYPHQIQKAIEDESDGKIILNFKTLNILNAIKNRTSKKAHS